MRSVRCLPSHASPFWEGSVVLALTLLAVTGASCRQEDHPETEPVPTMPETAPSGWVDVSGPETQQEDLAPVEGHSPSSEDDEGAAPEDSPAGDISLTPWRQARAGQWACYRMLNGYAQRAAVERADDRKVELVLEMFYEGHPVGLPARRTEHTGSFEPITRAQQHGAGVNMAAERIDVAGRSWVCVRWTTRWEDEGQQYEQDVWLSDEAPLSGLVLQEVRADGRIIARTQLIAFEEDDSSAPTCP